MKILKKINSKIFISEERRKYIKNRKKETSFMFPNIIETIIYLRIAEKFSCVERQIFWIEKAKYNSSNNPKVLKIILEDSTISEKIDAICEYMI